MAAVMRPLPAACGVAPKVGIESRGVAPRGGYQTQATRAELRRTVRVVHRCAPLAQGLGALEKLLIETISNVLRYLDATSLGRLDCTSRIWGGPQPPSASASACPESGLLSEAVTWHLVHRMRLPPSITFVNHAIGGRGGCRASALRAGETALIGLSAHDLAQIRRCRDLCVWVASASWDRRYGSPHCCVSGDGLTIMKLPSDRRFPWHAAFLMMDPLRITSTSFFSIRLQVENVGNGIMEVGLASRRDTAKQAALHWPGLRNTVAFTYANTGERFWNLPGITDDMWMKQHGETYGTGDVIDIELAWGMVRLRINGRLQDEVGSTFMAKESHWYVGVTLSDHARVRLVSTLFAGLTCVC